MPNSTPPYRIRLLVGAPNASMNGGLAALAGMVMPYDFTAGGGLAGALPLTVKTSSFWASAD